MPNKLPWQIEMGTRGSERALSKGSTTRTTRGTFRLGLGAELAGAEKFTPRKILQVLWYMSSIASIDLPRILGRLRPTSVRTT